MSYEELCLNLSLKIKFFRQQNHITQAIFAEMLDIDVRYLSDIERGLFYPTSENLEKISKILEVQPCELFDFEHHKPDEELKEEILKIIEKNPDKLKQIYRIINAIL